MRDSIEKLLTEVDAGDPDDKLKCCWRGETEANDDTVVGDALGDDVDDDVWDGDRGGDGDEGRGAK